MRILEAQCGKCGETFNPHREDELEHYAREDGTECGGTGELLGEWRAPSAHDIAPYPFEGGPNFGEQPTGRHHQACDRDLCHPDCPIRRDAVKNDLPYRGRRP